MLKNIYIVLKMQSYSESVSGLIPIKKGRVYLIYGFRGVGKSVFLLNLFKEFLTDDNHAVLDIPLTKNHLKKIYTLFEENTEALLTSNIFLSDPLNITRVRANRLKLFFLKSIYGKQGPSSIFIDDLIPPFLAVETDGAIPRQKSAKEIMLILSYLNLLSREGKTIFVTVREDLTNLTPYMFNLFSLTILDVLIRIRKRRHIREIFVSDQEEKAPTMKLSKTQTKFVKIGEFIIGEKAQIMLLKKSST